MLISCFYLKKSAGRWRASRRLRWESLFLQEEEAGSPRAEEDRRRGLRREAGQSPWGKVSARPGPRDWDLVTQGPVTKDRAARLSGTRTVAMLADGSSVSPAMSSHTLHSNGPFGLAQSPHTRPCHPALLPQLLPAMSAPSPPLLVTPSALLWHPVL